MRFNPIRPASYQIGLFGMRPRPLFPSRIIEQANMISQNALQARDPRLVDIIANILAQHVQTQRHRTAKMLAG